MILPDAKELLLKKVIEVKTVCRASSSRRMQTAALQDQWIETGAATGQRALVNKLFAHVDRLASHLFSPSELRFVMDFEAHYPLTTLSQAEVASRVLTREWERKDIDILFGDGVNRSLWYGSMILKQLWGNFGVEAQLIAPWRFGVFREDVCRLDDQEAVCETGIMTLPEVWRRISHLPDAKALYKQIAANSSKESVGDINTTFFHNVLSTSVLSENTSLTSNRQQPGGIVQLSGSPMLTNRPQVDVPMAMYHELYIKDDSREDYVTCLIIEPDILVSPFYKKENMFAPQTQPYSLIQANSTPGNIWGRSEIADLVEPQGLLAEWMGDLRRLMGVQFDKILAFAGNEGITPEKYDQMRAAGYFDLGPGGQVNDVTPHIPAEAFKAIEVISRFMDEISGFGNILSGQGEPGVRAGNHAETLTKMASPRLRDRSLLVERQCAAAADKTLRLLQTKDDGQYSTDPTAGKETQFVLYDLPGDRRVTVDSHSSSPIFADDHQQLIAFGLKSGYIGGDTAIEQLPYPQKDTLKQRYAAMQAAKAKLVQEHPEILTHQKAKK